MSDPHGPLTEAVRSLIDAVIRTEVDPDRIGAAHAHVAAALEILGERMIPGSFGVRVTPDGRSAPCGNVLIGQRNAIAPR